MKGFIREIFYAVCIGILSVGAVAFIFYACMFLEKIIF